MLERARELSSIISRSPEYLAYRKAENDLMQDAAVLSIAGDIAQRQSEMINSVNEADYDPKTAVAAQQDLERLKAQLDQTPAYQSFLEKQRAFQKLMDSVYEALASQLGGAAASESGCSSDCSGCSGCGHEH